MFEPEKIIESILIEGDLMHSEPSVLEVMRSDLRKSLDRYCTRFLSEAVPSHKRNRFDLVMMEGNQEKLARWFDENIPDKDAVLDKAVAEFRKDYLG